MRGPLGFIIKMQKSFGCIGYLEVTNERPCKCLTHCKRRNVSLREKDLEATILTKQSNLTDGGKTYVGDISSHYTCEVRSNIFILAQNA